MTYLLQFIADVVKLLLVQFYSRVQLSLQCSLQTRKIGNQVIKERKISALRNELTAATQHGKFECELIRSQKYLCALQLILKCNLCLLNLLHHCRL